MNRVSAARSIFAHPTHFLLLESPVRELCTMREQVTARHHVSKPEMTSKGSKTFPSKFLILSASSLGCNLDKEIVIGISSEPGGVRYVNVRRRFLSG
jgi:hypothetical protein